MGNTIASSESLHELQQRFKRDDTLSLCVVEELVEEMRVKENLQKKVPPHFIRDIFAKLDSTGVGYISFSQFESAFRALQEKRQLKRPTMRATRSSTPPPETSVSSPHLAVDTQTASARPSISLSRPPHHMVAGSTSPGDDYTTSLSQENPSADLRAAGVQKAPLGRPISQPRSPRQATLSRGRASRSADGEIAYSPRVSDLGNDCAVSRAQHHIRATARTSEEGLTPRDETRMQREFSSKDENDIDALQSRKKVASPKQQVASSSMAALRRGPTQRHSAIEGASPSQSSRHTERSLKPSESFASPPMTPVTPRTMAELCAQAQRDVENGSKAATPSDERSPRSRPERRVSTWPARSSGDSHSPVKVSEDTGRPHFGKDESPQSKVASGLSRVAKSEVSNTSSSDESDSNSVRLAPQGNTHTFPIARTRRSGENPMLGKSSSRSVGTVEQKQPSRAKASQPKSTTTVAPSPRSNPWRDSSKSSQSDSAPIGSPRPVNQKSATTAHVDTSKCSIHSPIDEASPRKPQGELKHVEGERLVCKDGIGLLAAIRKVEADYGPRRRSELLESPIVEQINGEVKEAQTPKQIKEQLRDRLHEEQSGNVPSRAKGELSKVSVDGKLSQAGQRGQMRLSPQCQIEQSQHDSEPIVKSPREETPRRRRHLRSAARVNTMALDCEEQRLCAHEPGEKMGEQLVVPEVIESGGDHPTTPRRKPVRIFERANKGTSVLEQCDSSTTNADMSWQSLGPCELQDKLSTPHRVSTQHLLDSSAPSLHIDIQPSPASPDSALNSLCSPSPHQAETYLAGVASQESRIDGQLSSDSYGSKVSHSQDLSIGKHENIQKKEHSHTSPVVAQEPTFTPSNQDNLARTREGSGTSPGQQSSQSPQMARRDSIGLDAKDRTLPESENIERPFYIPSIVANSASPKLHSVDKGEEAQSSSDESISGIMALSRRPSGRGMSSSEQLPAELWKPGEPKPSVDLRERCGDSNVHRDAQTEQSWDDQSDNEYSHVGHRAKHALVGPRLSIPNHSPFPNAIGESVGDESGEYNDGHHKLNDPLNIPRTSYKSQLAVPRASSQPSRSSQSGVSQYGHDKKHEKAKNDSDRITRRRSKAFLGSADKEPKQEESFQSWLFKNVF